MRAIVVANGPEPAYPLGFVRGEGDWIIAADGGSINALRWGWIPNAVVGDHDSLPPDLEESLHQLGCHFERFPARKDWTDLELAIRYASDGGATEIVVVGLRGGRLDQELASLLLLARSDWDHLSIGILDGRQRAFVLRDHLTLEGRVGDTVSLLPLCREVAGITTRGLEWVLDDEDLRFGSTRGVSNVLASTKAEINVRSGVLLVVHTIADGHSDKNLTDEQACLGE